MDDDDANIILQDNDIAAVAILSFCKKARKRRQCDAREILKQRTTLGYYRNLIAEMRLSDTEYFKNFHRMTPQVFDDLLYIIGPTLQKFEGFAMNPITPGERLSITLRLVWIISTHINDYKKY